MLEFKPAVRKAVPMLISVAGTSGSGKTYSALLLAAGIAGPNGLVGLIDTENGRGAMYADSPGITNALPNGFLRMDLPAPFSPQRYIEAVEAAEAAGINVLVIDSGSHEWEGTGGCSEIAEADKNRWNRAKLANRRYVYRLLYSSMHIIVCLRAREKSKIIPKHLSSTGKEEVVSLGVLPICEKNFVFEMLLSLQLDEATHAAIPIKVPEPLLPLFPTGKLLTKADGERIRQWNDTGAVLEAGEQLRKRARATAEEGMQAYAAFFKALAPTEKKSLADVHAELKSVAQQADADSIPEVDELPLVEPNTQPGARLKCNGEVYQVSEDMTAWTKVSNAQAA